MKKFIMAVLLIVIFLPSIVLANNDRFYEAEYLPDAYIKKFQSGSSKGKYQQMRLFRRSSDNMPAYCIELWENVSPNEWMTLTNIDSYNLLSNEVKNKIELYAYYGYGYPNHTDLSWYVATQFLIWKETSPTSTLYFTDKLNGNQVDKFTNEMNEIINLVNQHNTLPSFHTNTYELGLNEEMILVDSNNVLNDYNVVFSNNKTYQEHNAIIVNANSYSTSNIVLEKGISNNRTQIYFSNNSQDLLVRGNYNPIISYFTLKVTAGKISISKIDEDTKSFISQGEAKLVGTTYNLYDFNNNLVQVLEINNLGNAISIDLPYGTYYLKESKAGIGYQLDNNTYEVNLTKENPYQQLTLSNKVIKNTVKINKLYQPLNTNNVFPEEDAIFGFYNKNNERIGQIIIDQYGSGEIDLPYGKYLVKQEVSKENYNKIEDFTIEVNEKTSSELKYTFTNKEYGSSLKIIKLDKDSMLPIKLSKTSFKIKNMLTNEYIIYNNSDIFNTDDQGVLLLPIKLSIGKYQLEEVKPPIGYKLMKKPYVFEVTEDSGDLIELKIENEKDLGKLEIIKYGEIINIIDNKLVYSKKTLKNIEFSLYASENIISGDGTVHYQKDELIMKQETDDIGNIIFNNLLYGKYYIIETKTLDSHNKDNNKYHIEINQNRVHEVLEKINTLKKADIKINKLDDLTLLPISNVEFELYNENNTKVDSNKTSKNGEIYFINLPLGKYYIKEVNAPFPYIIDNKIIEVELKENNTTVELILKNKKQYLEEEIPKTSVNETKYKNILILIPLVNFIYLHFYYKCL